MTKKKLPNTRKKTASSNRSSSNHTTTEPKSNDTAATIGHNPKKQQASLVDSKAPKNDKLTKREILEQRKSKVKRFLQMALPHVALFGFAVLYCVVGSVAMRALEQPVVDTQRLTDLLLLRDERLRMLAALRQLHRQQVDIRGPAGERLFNEYTQTVYDVHRRGALTTKDLQKVLSLDADQSAAVDDRLLEETVKRDDWSFDTSFFFVFASLATIGFGDLTPVSFRGRIFFLCYAAVGVPIVLVTTADAAKFLSRSVTAAYVYYLSKKYQLLRWMKGLSSTPPKPTSVPAHSRPPSNSRSSSSPWRRKLGHADCDVAAKSHSGSSDMVDYMWSNIDNMHEVRVHASVVLLIVLLYCCMGGVVLGWVQPRWSFFDCFYFSFISCMKIGFGDLVPDAQGLWVALIYSFCGLCVATMCIDLVGSHYLDRLHQFGRRMATADYVALIKKAKQMRRRKQMIEQQYNTMLRITQLEGVLAVTDDSCADATSQLQTAPIEDAIKEEPPPTPTEVKVVDVTPYSIKVTWTPPNSPHQSTRYTVNCRMKHTKSVAEMTATDVVVNEHEFEPLRSFAIYEISVFAQNDFGFSNTVRFSQVTEPESAPQRLHVELVSPTTVKVTWQPPCRKIADVVGYTVYYSRRQSLPFEEWRKTKANRDEFEIVIRGLETLSRYWFCIGSVYDRGHSPLSNLVTVQTGCPAFSGVKSMPNPFAQRRRYRIMHSIEKMFRQHPPSAPNSPSPEKKKIQTPPPPRLRRPTIF